MLGNSISLTRFPFHAKKCLLGLPFLIGPMVPPPPGPWSPPLAPALGSVSDFGIWQSDSHLWRELAARGLGAGGVPCQVTEMTTRLAPTHKVIPLGVSTGRLESWE